MTAPIAYVSRNAVKGHLMAAFQTTRRHVDGLGDLSGGPTDQRQTLGHRLAALQDHLIAEVRWLQSIAAGADATAQLFGDAGRQEFLKRYSSELVFLIAAIKAAVVAGPIREGYDREQHAKGWRRVATGITRVLKLEDEARQL